LTSAPQPDAERKPVTVEFTLSEPEVVRSFRWVLLRQGRLVSLADTGLLFLVLGVALLAFGHSPVPGFAAMAIAVGCLALFLYPVLRNPRTIWRRTASLRQAQSIRFSEDGCEARSDVATLDVTWEIFTSCIDTPLCYMLTTRDRTTLPVPKRAFASADDEERFRDLVGRHLGSFR
jgi:hypothetical protein